MCIMMQVFVLFFGGGFGVFLGIFWNPFKGLDITFFSRPKKNFSFFFFLYLPLSSLTFSSCPISFLFFCTMCLVCKLFKVELFMCFVR